MGREGPTTRRPVCGTWPLPWRSPCSSRACSGEGQGWEGAVPRSEPRYLPRHGSGACRCRGGGWGSSCIVLHATTSRRQRNRGAAPCHRPQQHHLTFEPQGRLGWTRFAMPGQAGVRRGSRAPAPCVPGPGRYGPAWACCRSSSTAARYEIKHARLDCRRAIDRRGGRGGGVGK